MSGYKFSQNPVDVPLIQTENRLIKTAIPGPGSKVVLRMLDEYESRSMQGQLPIVWERAEGHSLFDKVGNKWIDFTSTIFVANAGHGNAAVRKAVSEVLEKPLLHTYAYPNRYRSDYCKHLVQFCGDPFEKVFLLSAGTEATEAALKLMRMNARRIGKRRPGIICMEGNWHGRTLGAQMMSGNPGQKEWIGYLDPNIFHIPFPYPWSCKKGSGPEFLEDGLKNLEAYGVDISKDICGFMLETFQGWGAVFYPEDFVRAIKQICIEYNILLTFDEMQAGFGRTGRKFGYQHYDVEPDLLCCGKGIASGFPLSAVIGKREVMDLPEIGNMSSTHSANPICCAAGLTTLEEIVRLDLIAESQRKGELLFKELNRIKQKYSDRISYVLGKGLIAAVHFCKRRSEDADVEFPNFVAEKAMQKGLLVVHTGRESIKLAPPLVITDEALLEGLAVLNEAIDECNSAFENINRL